MKTVKQRVLFLIFLFLSIILIITIIWGYNNYLKVKELINTNQKLMKILRENTVIKSSIVVKEGMPIKDFIIRTINHQNIVISSDSHAILLFIDISCSACVYFLNDFYNSIKDFRSDKLIIIALGLKSEESLSELREKINIPIYFAYDSFAKLHRYFGIKGSPSMVYIKNGIIKIIADPFNYKKRMSELINLLKGSKGE